jgi:NAD(P)H-dependent FMN reductase
MHMKLYLPILLGTAREGRQSEKAAQYVLRQAQGQAFETELLDVRDFVGDGRTQGMDEVKTTQWSQIMKRADGLIIIVPEYNNGYPGELKLMLDQIYDEYAQKAVALCGVSMGWSGGVRAVKQLVMVAHTLKMHPIRNGLYFQKVTELFDDGGAIKNPEYDQMAATMFEELVWWTEALKAKREG